MQYRKEIDGLRAIAVLPVIFFHGGISGFSGGYIGVDIFFVISGYLITSIILEEKKQKKFSIIKFYERRARRILPALTVVLILTTIAAYLFMPASLLKSYSHSLISVALFASNFYFYKMNGYFSPASDEQPLLHTWSLAVEEQYYLFFPLFIVLLWPKGEKFLAFWVFLIAVVSLLFTQYLVSIRLSIDANFYLIFSRAWELLFGSIIALYSLQYRGTNRWKREIYGMLGIILIVYSIVFFDDNTPFPSFYTLIPALGACLIIIFVNSISYVGRVLSSRILVFTGLISYSLYLWHQPLFAFLRFRSIGEPSTLMMFTAIILTLFLATLSWKYVEKPFRNKEKFSRVLIFKLSAASLILFITIGLAGAFNNGFEQRFSVSSYTASIESSPKREECHANPINRIRPINACKYFGENITWAVYGDSHAVETGYALARKLEPYDIGLVHLSFGGCPPALLYEVKRPGCTKWVNESLDYLEGNRNIKHVLLAFRHSYHLFGDHRDSYPNLPNVDPGDNFTDAFLKLAHEDSRDIYWRSFEKIVSRLLKAGKNIYILYPVPELPIEIDKAVMPFSVLGDSTVLDLKRSTSVEYYFSRNKFIIDKLDILPYGENLHAIKPFEVFCDEFFCSAVKDNKALYFDADHPSISGADLIVERIDVGKKGQKSN